MTKVSTRRKIYRITIIATLVYCSIGIALYHLQKKFLFHPAPLPHDYQFKFSLPFEEINIPMNKTDTLNLIRFFPSDSITKGVVIYFHGNGGNVTRYEKLVNNFTSHGFELWIPDYPGYGKTTGKLTEENMYAQAKEAYKLAHSKFSADSIILYGRSLGSGLASYIASKENCSRLILETPFYNIPDLFSHYVPIYPTGRMSKFQFPVAEYLRQVKVPVSVFHGTADHIVPYSQSIKLKKVLKPGDELITIENGEHNNLSDFQEYRSRLDSILSLY